MTAIQLTDEFSLLLEKQGTGVRLTVIHGNDALVCRKATSRELSRFFDAETGTAFKGRLKMHIADGMVTIEAKNKRIGALARERLRREINATLGVS